MEVMTLPARIEAKIEVGDCWRWTASLDDDGYGRVNVAGRSRGAHRVVYEILVGAIPPGMTLDHLCRNHACVNPDHVEVVSRAVNSLRGYGAPALAARRGECPKGHPYDATNLNGHGRLARRCLRCSAEKSRRYKQSRAAAA